MKKKCTLLQSFGLVLFSTVLLLQTNDNVLADDIVSTKEDNTDYNSNSSPNTLDTSIEAAKQNGIILVETKEQVFQDETLAEQDTQKQINTINQAVESAKIEEQTYNQEVQNYQTYLEDKSKYEQDSIKYENYLKEIAAYQENYQQYEADKKLYDETLVANKEKQDTYQSELKTYEEASRTYEDNLQAYENGQLTNEALQKQYEEAKQKYEQDLLAYQNLKKNYDQAQLDDLEAEKRYQQALEIYQNQQKTYILAKARYEEEMLEAQGKLGQTGYLTEVLAQNLIFRSEPNTTQTFTGKYISPEQLALLSKHTNNWFDPGTVNFPISTKTVTTKGQWNAAYMKIGDSVQVDYSGLENSSFSGHKLARVRYTYTLLNSTHYDESVILQAIDDPTVTAYVHIYNKDDRTTGSFEIEMKVQFFDNEGMEIIPNDKQYALTSFASINSLNGSGEYVAGYNGILFPITGSTITIKDGRAMNFSSTPQESLASGWDSNTSPDAYIGAIVGKSTETIRFNFGNSNGFAYWFAFNSDVKAKGILGPEPIAPIKPIREVINIPSEPVRPTEPLVPNYQILSKPIPPVKPSEPKLISVSLPLEPVKPKEVKNPREPLVVKKPSSPKPMVVFYHRSIYRPPTKRPSRSSKPVAAIKTLPARAIPPVTTYPVNQPRIRSNPEPKSPTVSYYPTYRPSIVNKASKTSPKIKTWVHASTPSLMEKELKDKQAKLDINDYFQKNLNIDTRANSASTLDYIDFLAKKLGEKHKGDQAKINRDLAIMLAYSSYSTDKLQKLLNNFVEPYEHDNKNKITLVIDANHRDSTAQIDFAHTMTTLASLEQQDNHLNNMTKGIFSLHNPLYYVALVTKGGKVGAALSGFDLVKALAGQYNKETILQLNSFVGDIYTYNSIKDVHSDMDAVILSSHPDYKNLPLAERIKAYYGQSDLNEKRQKLFLESYDKNTKKAGEKAALDMIEASLTMGGVIALGYALLNKRKPKDIAQNLAITDNVALGGTFDRWRQKPFEAVKDISSIYIEKAVNKVKAIVSPIVKIGKNVVKTIKDTANSLVKTGKNILKSGKKQFNKFIEFISPKKKVSTSKPAKKSPAKVSKSFSKIGRNITRPITGMLQKLTGNSKVSPKPKASAKPKASPKPKTTAKLKASPKPKPTAKRKASPKPKPTAKPKARPKPKASAKPKASPKPKPTAKPKARPKPKASAKPKASPKPKVATKPKARPKQNPKSKGKRR
ncbi:glucan-binding protein [Streptococcus suis]|nr:glucan-binding protein [Streptococcus suis]NQP41786.1 glucan-binding protein [Streptococcus suis]NQP44648.1 glucan-binding protein [Streptococcus suis]NQP49000.1 glucan-binding protein [Streptococcus suis]NQP57116.1 glucan-binding protein [Streptococcus suis]